MKLTTYAAALLLAATTTGCATRASSVAPVSISANEYRTLSCDDGRVELQGARERMYALTRRQNNAATADAAAVFLFALPLGSVFGADVSGELAQAKGEVLALERHVRMACSGEPLTPTALSTPASAPVATPIAAPGASASPARKVCAIRSPTNPDAVSC